MRRKIFIAAVCACFTIVVCEPAAASPDIMGKLHDLKEKLLNKGSQPTAEAQELPDGEPDMADESMAAGMVNLAADDTNLDWSQFDSKTGKAAFSKKGFLDIESKDDKRPVMTVTEIPVIPDANYEIAVSLQAKPEDDKFVGIVFDYQNQKNYKSIVVSKKTFVYSVTERGDESVVKEGLVKPGKLISNIGFRKEGTVVRFLLNDVEVSKIKNVDITTPIFGVIVGRKGKASIAGISYRVDEQQETEMGSGVDE